MGKDLKGKELGEYLSQRTDGKYMARFTNRFGKRTCLYGSDLKALKKRLNEAIYEDSKKSNAIDENITLSEWFEKWLLFYKKDNIRPTTYEMYVSIFKNHINPHIGNVKLTDIKSLHVFQVINNAKNSGCRYETQDKIKAILSGLFNKAIENELMIKNYCTYVKIARDTKNTKVLTKYEQKLFFECCKGTFYDNLFTVAINTGLRCGEICALTWDDIDWDNRLIKVTRTLLYFKDTQKGDEGKVFRLGETKTKTSNRSIPINNQCEVALKKQRMQKFAIESKVNIYKPIQGFENLLFTTPYGTPINSQTYKDAITRIVKDINLQRDGLEQIEYFGSHTFRHTFATRCFESDIPPKVVQQYLGHSSIEMTMDIYTHVMEDYKVTEITKLDLDLDNSIEIDKLDDRISQIEKTNQSNIIKMPYSDNAL